MPIQLFDTLTNRKQAFVPLEPGKVRLYVCGPTVYDMSHLGHARCYVAWDVVTRHLRWRGFDVTYVRNFTDVDDKIIRRARERGEDPKLLASRFVDEFHRDMDALQVLRPDEEPRVTTHMPEIVTLIGELVKKGHAYASGGDVYFAVRSFAEYGKLSGRQLDDLKSGARVEPGEHKRDPLDFALWKAAKEGEIFWESPWGRGRPGWHIECSAMSVRYLGMPFDIHAGGKDLVFPHHENEIAQSEAAAGKALARFWMHNGFVTADEEKMSKSLGNFFTVRDLLQQFDPQALRLFLLSTHYRAPINFTEDALRGAEKRVEYIYETLAKVEARLNRPEKVVEGAPLLEPERVEALLTGFGEAMDDDFNSAEALGRLSSYLTWMNELADRNPPGAPKGSVRRTLERLRDDFLTTAEVLGVGCEPHVEVLARLRNQHARQRNIDIEAVERLLAERAEARRQKDFARSDALRDEAAKMGVEIMDTAQGTAWRVPW